MLEWREIFSFGRSVFPERTVTKISDFTMEFQPQTIEHLGLRLYSSLPPVIGELVSNAWDADSPDVDITIPVGPITPSAEVVVSDHGHGMDANTLQQHYLQIGRDRREEEHRDTSPGGRKLTGRKGLGKLAAFGVANVIELRTVRSEQAICLRFVYEDMKKWPRGSPYKPTIISERSGPTTEGNGTELRIRGMKRTAPISLEWIRKELARRFRFISTDFVARINGRMTWDHASPTITGGCTTPCKGRFGHPDRRRLTISVREAALLQTFPKKYRFRTNHIEKVCDLIGNAVPPKYARLAGRKILSAVADHRRRGRHKTK